MTEPEIWRDVEGFEGIYQISSHGRLKSLARVSTFVQNGKLVCRPIKEKLVVLHGDKRGYPVVGLHKNGSVVYNRIHRLVARAFVPNDDFENCNVVCHKDDDPKNNFYGNLYWGTQKTNHSDSVANGR